MNENNSWSLSRVSTAPPPDPRGSRQRRQPHYASALPQGGLGCRFVAPRGRCVRSGILAE
eukprot:1515361-Alexandrium_andersonii.AAC.1